MSISTFDNVCACTKNIHIAVNTNGFVNPEIFKSIVEKIDLFLFELQLIDNEQHKYYTGKSNTSILKNLRTLNQKNKETWIRIPIMQGINNTVENLNQILEQIKEFDNIKRVTFLPHQVKLDNSYKRMEIENLDKGIDTTTQQYRDQAQELFEKNGFNVTTISWD